MSRLMNDISFLLAKKPISIVNYIDPNGKIIEINAGDLSSQGAKYFEIPVKGQEKPKRWALKYPPYKDELGRDNYICPYNAITNVNLDWFTEDKDEKSFINALLSEIEPALDREFSLGQEQEKRRQSEGMLGNKNKMPLGLIVALTGGVFVVVFIIMIAMIYFMG